MLSKLEEKEEIIQMENLSTKQLDFKKMGNKNFLGDSS